MSRRIELARPHRSERCWVQVTAEGRAFPFDIEPGVQVRVGSSAEMNVRIAGVAPHQCSLRWGEGRLELTDASGDTLLNDVQVRERAQLRAGDVVRLGDAALVVATSRLPAATQRLASRAELEARVQETVARSARSGATAALLLIRLGGGKAESLWLPRLAQLVPPHTLWARLDADLFAALLGAVEAQVFDELREQVVSMLGGEGLRFALGHARLPVDGSDAWRLWEVTLERLLGLGSLEVGEVQATDPVVCRLQEAIERAHGAVLLTGAPGAGKASLAMSAGASVLPRLDRSAPGEQDARLSEALARGGRLVVTAVDPAQLGPQVRARLLVHLRLPHLRDRPTDVLALAELFLSRAARALRKSRLSLSPPARALLQGYDWPGEVRELKNAIELAALLSGDAVTAEALPPAVLAAGHEPVADLRRSLAATERDALRRALEQTRWNVTAAAKQLGLPRRTIVYRMSRLGLRRPPR